MSNNSLTLRHLYCGTPSTVRGEPTHISADPTGESDRVVYGSGRVAVIRSLSDPLSALVFSQHTAPVTTACFSPDAKFVASADESGTVRIWLPDTAVQKSEFDVFPGPVRDMAFSRDGKFLATCGECRGAFVKVVKVPTGAGAGLGKGHTKRAIAVDCAGRLVASSSEDMSVGLYPGPQMREFDTPSFLRHHTAFVNDVRFSPDAQRLAIASSDRTTSVYDTSTNEVVHTLTGHSASVTGVAWLSEDQLVTSSNDKTIKIWSLQDGSCTSTMVFGKDVGDMQVGCDFVPKTGEVASVSLHSVLNVRHPSQPEVARSMRGHSKQIIGLAAVGSRFYTADYSGVLVSWDLDAGSSKTAFNGKGPATSVCSIAANHDAIASVGQDGKIFVTPSETLTFPKPVVVKGGGVDIALAHSSSPEFSAIMVNETRLVAVNTAGDAVTAEMKFDNSETGSCVAVSPDGALVAVGFEVAGGSGELRFYTVSGSSFNKAGEVIKVRHVPNRLAFSPDGDFVAVGDKGRTVTFFNCTTRSKIVGGGMAHTARVDAICFSLDGTFVASGGMDGSVAVWPVDSDKEAITMKSAHRNGVTGIAFVSAECVVTSGGDSCVRSWNL